MSCFNIDDAWNYYIQNFENGDVPMNHMVLVNNFDEFNSLIQFVFNEIYTRIGNLMNSNIYHEFSSIAASIGADANTGILQSSCITNIRNINPEMYNSVYGSIMGLIDSVEFVNVVHDLEPMMTGRNLKNHSGYIAHKCVCVFKHDISRGMYPYIILNVGHDDFKQMPGYAFPVPGNNIQEFISKFNSWTTGVSENIHVIPLTYENLKKIIVYCACGGNSPIGAEIIGTGFIRNDIFKNINVSTLTAFGTPSSANTKTQTLSAPLSQKAQDTIRESAKTMKSAAINAGCSVDEKGNIELSDSPKRLDKNTSIFGRRMK